MARRLPALLAISLLAVMPLFSSGMLGVFQGKIVRGPVPQGKARWLYVQSRNGMVRRVDIARAVVAYDEAFPSAQRRTPAAEGLRQELVVRITAEQGKSKKGDGEWRGKEVLIVWPQETSGDNGEGRKKVAENTQKPLGRPF